MTTLPPQQNKVSLLRSLFLIALYTRTMLCHAMVQQTPYVLQAPGDLRARELGGRLATVRPLRLFELLPTQRAHSRSQELVMHGS